MNKLKKYFLVSIVIVITCFLSSVAYAKVGDAIGVAYNTDIVAYINHYAIPSYAVNGQSVIVAEDLMNFGFDVIWDNNTRSLNIKRNMSKTSVNEMNFAKEGYTGTFFADILETDISVFANGEKITSYAINGYTVIPVEELTCFGEIYWVEQERALKLWIDQLHIRAEKQKIYLSKNAIASKYPKHNIRILYADAVSNSVGGIEPTIVWRNDSGKTIKYIYFTCVPYNSVGDIVSCSISGKTSAKLQSTGPYDTFNISSLKLYPRMYYKRWAAKVYEDWNSPGKYWVGSQDLYTPITERYYLTENDYKDVFNIENSWDPIWYNYSIDYIRITKVNVVYIDGTSETINNPPIWREVFRNAGI